MTAMGTFSQDCFQSQAGEGVRLYDSYFWLVIHHKSMDS